MKTFWLMLVAVRLYGQSLQLPSEVNATRNSNVTLALSLSAGQRKLTALQWEIVVPIEQTTLETYKVGSMGRSAEKTLQCAGGRVAGKLHIYRCILAGGLKPIQNGDVADLRFSVRNASLIKIRIENAKGVSADLKATDFAASEGRIVIR